MSWLNLFIHNHVLFELKLVKIARPVIFESLDFNANFLFPLVQTQANGSSLGQCAANVDTDSSPGNVKKLTEMAEEMLKQKNVESVMFEGKRVGEKSNYEKLDWFAGELVAEHQRRSSRIAPTVVFKQINPNPS